MSDNNQPQWKRRVEWDIRIGQKVYTVLGDSERFALKCAVVERGRFGQKSAENFLVVDRGGEWDGPHEDQEFVDYLNEHGRPGAHDGD